MRHRSSGYELHVFMFISIITGPFFTSQIGEAICWRIVVATNDVLSSGEYLQVPVTRGNEQVVQVTLSGPPAMHHAHQWV